MQTIAVISQKGGTGKTTTALGVAVAGVRDRKRIVVVDLDAQPTATNWSDRRENKEEPAVVSCQAARLHHVLDAARSNGADLAVIDTAGNLSEAMMAAVEAADLVLVPVRPNTADVETLPSVQRVLANAGKRHAAVLVSQAPIQGSRHEEAIDVARQMGFEVCPSVVHMRVAHGDAIAGGMVAAELDPDGKAAEEMQAVYEYCRKALRPRRNAA